MSRHRRAAPCKRNVAFAPIHQQSKRSIKRDVKKKSSASTGGEIFFSRSNPLKFHFSGEVWLKIDSSGSLTILHSFAGDDGKKPDGALVQGTDGNFYGTTQAGGTNTSGTVFSISVGLGPFVKTIPSSGSAGTQVFILGNGLIGTSSVTFNDIPATFTVVSQTEITATVPNGATTAKVKVTTPGGLRTSSVAFWVTN